MKSHKLGINAIFNVFYMTINVLFPIVVVSYVSKILLPDGVGLVASAQNFVSYFTMLASLGIPTYGVRVIARCKNDFDARSNAFSELISLNAIMTTVCMAFYFGVILFFETYRNNITLYLAVGMLLFFNYFNVDWLYQGLEAYASISIRGVIIKTLSLLLIILFVNNQSDSIIYALISSAAVGANNLYNCIRAKKYVKYTFRDIELKKHYRPITWLFLSVVSAELYSKVDVSMLSRMCGNNEVGYYTNSQKTISIICTVSAAMTAVFLPRLSDLFFTNREKFNSLIGKGTSILFYLTVPMLIGINIVVVPLFNLLFGNLFSPAVVSARILSPLIVIKGLGDLLCYQTLIATNNEKKITYAAAMTAVMNVVLNACLIPMLSQNGAAIASVVSELANNSLLLYWSLKILKIDWKKCGALKALISGICMGVLLIPIKKLFSDDAAGIVLTVIVGATLYFVFSIVLRHPIGCLVIETLKKKILRGKK